MTSISNLSRILTIVCFTFNFNTDYVYDCELYGNLKKNNVIQNMSKINIANHNIIFSEHLQENTHPRFACTPNMNAELTQEHTKTGESCMKA